MFCVGFDSKFTFGFHTCFVGDGDFEDGDFGITISSSASISSSSPTMFSLSRYQSLNLETSPS
jgi:hypothetical protein